MNIYVKSIRLQRKVAMDTERSSKKSRPAFKAAILFVVLIAMTAIHSKSAFSQISCYKGNVQEGNYIGDLSSVTTPDNAAQDCNSLYDECQGQCLACIYDDDLTEDICYDGLGNKFLKPD
jgi:hypothetical protein